MTSSPEIHVDADGKKWERLYSAPIGMTYYTGSRIGDRWVLERPLPEPSEAEKLAKGLQTDHFGTKHAGYCSEPGCARQRAAALLRSQDAELKRLRGKA